ncbi:diacylglycerol kinase family protein [Candidatus Parcubacteria bacterium]|nr:diacylglycerol kinase family protein [Candidatus Parcubacteria bacterium]
MIRIKRLFKSFSYAAKGLIKTFKEEQNLRIQAVVGLLVLCLAWFFRVGRLEWAFLTAVIFLVILVEIINSAMERAADVLKPRIDSYVKEIKDIMAAAVMIASIAAVVIGIIILGPYFIDLFS